MFLKFGRGFSMNLYVGIPIHPEGRILHFCLRYTSFFMRRYEETSWLMALEPQVNPVTRLHLAYCLNEGVLQHYRLFPAWTDGDENHPSLEDLL